MATTGILASEIVTLSSSAASLSAAGFINALWNGALTGKITHFLAPAACSSSEALVTPAVVPAMTTCPGQLKLTACTSAVSAVTFSQISIITFLSRPITAAMPPSPTGTASCINAPRLCTSKTASSKRRTPAATRAEYSPRLCPPTISGCRPCSFKISLQITLIVRIAGCVFAVSCNDSAGPLKHISMIEYPSASSAA